MPLTFSAKFLLHLLKLMPIQMVTNIREEEVLKDKTMNRVGDDLDVN